MILKQLNVIKKVSEYFKLLKRLFIYFFATKIVHGIIIIYIYGIKIILGKIFSGKELEEFF